MTHIYVEFSGYGVIGDFEVEEDMTDRKINEIAWEIVEQFASDNMSIVRVEDDEEY